ncbi:TadE/TadG family type IV pilus assembly protein [Pseudarthrobacter phenanthrenivorans]|uniref:TadE/TadG family type IV pilus assembly protein n=1 Tax=Pseudarthrobacter phenanthrenivorans TaxID=361575 RepID=UPI001FE2C2FC|nr:Tad domain-containing protein [Pseudarthrobacter phenanthrenivorans]
MRQDTGSEKGAATVFVAILLVVLLGVTALAVDVGAAYAEKSQLQNGADAAALAIARDCAEGDCGSFDATGGTLASSNANDAISGSTVSFPGEATVRVVTAAREPASTSDGFSLFFAQIFGMDSTNIGAVAEASWGPPSEANTLPWTAHQCVFKNSLSASQLAEFNSTGAFTGDPSTALMLLRYDTNATAPAGCPAGGYQPGGFGWLETSGDGCSADIDLDATVEGQPGNHFPNDPACDAVLATIMDEPALIPLYSAVDGSGENAEYTLIGFGAFQVTGYKFSGGAGVNISPTSACTGNCRALQGYFARFVSLEEGIISTDDGPNFGGSLVALTE